MDGERRRQPWWVQALVHNPLLELDELDMPARELPLIVLPFQLAVAS
jgi:hypothetical protein